MIPSTWGPYPNLAPGQAWALGSPPKNLCPSVPTLPRAPHSQPGAEKYPTSQHFGENSLHVVKKMSLILIQMLSVNKLGEIST